MPIYEYECLDQRHRFEKWQSIQDEPIKTCPVCGSPVRKLFHPAGIIFKGSGWYITDSRKSSSGSVTGESRTETKNEAKSDTKGEKPSDSGAASSGSESKSEKSTGEKKD